MDATREICGIDASGQGSEANLQPPQLLSMAKGFSWVLLGLLLGLVLFFADASFEFFDAVRIPAYGIGSSVAAWGLLMLNDSGRVSRTWARRGGIALATVLLQIYFVPFVGWWRAAPQVSFLVANYLSLILAGMFSLFYMNLLAAESARRLFDRAGRIESLLFAAAVVILMIIPFGALVFQRGMACVNGAAAPYSELIFLVNRAPLWARGVAAIPCALTLVSLWKARDRCYRAFLAGG